MRLRATEEIRFLLLGGEAVVAYGPLVMSTMGEICQEYQEYRDGAMRKGGLPIVTLEVSMRERV